MRLGSACMRWTEAWSATAPGGGASVRLGRGWKGWKDGRPAALAAALLALAGCGQGAPAGPVEIKLGHVGAPGSLFSLSAEEFATRANARLASENLGEVVVYGSSQLGGADVLLQKLKLGTVDLALPSSIMSSRIDAFGLFEMPYLVRSREHMKRIEEEIFWPELAPLAAEQGYRVLAVWENGFRHVTNNVRPVHGPEDLDGLKLRTPRGTWRIKLFQQFGANPTPMALSEVFIALKTGVVDGQENPLSQIHASRLYEAQEYLSLTGHVYTPAYLTASADGWSKLPAAVRTVLEEEAKAVQAFVYERAARLDADLADEIAAAGVEVNTVDRSRFLENSRTIYDEFGATVQDGRELVALALPLAYR